MQASNSGLSRARKTVPVVFTPSQTSSTPIPLLVQLQQQATEAGDEMFPPSPPPSSILSEHSKRIQAIELMMNQESALSPKKHEVRYLISTEWWWQWQNTTEDESAGFNLPIENWPLVPTPPCKYDYQTDSFSVRADLDPERDYLSVSSNVWNALHSWYNGGPPLPRLKSRMKGGLDISTELSVSAAIAALSAAAPSVTISTLCFCCKRPTGERCSSCSVVYYCSRICQSSHWKYHKSWCRKEFKGKDLKEVSTLVDIGRMGKTGLVNLGNSCYMNSGLQCLSHVSTLTNLLLSDSYAQDINQKNLDGTGGELVKQYSLLLRDLWFGTSGHISPSSFKRTAAKINPDYAGFAQHDVHELLEFFIDKIHEDLNKIGKKPYTEIPEGDGTNDADIANLTWDRHSLRHESIVKDVFGGQLRSQLVCPTCQRVSVKFDYFTTLQLAIPLQSEVIVKVLYVHATYNVAEENRKPMLLSIKIDLNKNARYLKTLVVEQLQAVFGMTLDQTSIELFEVDPETRLPISLMTPSTFISEITGSVVFAYRRDITHDQFLFVYNRAFIFNDSGATSNNDAGAMEVIGYPIGFSFHRDMNFSKIRFYIWLQLRRFVRFNPVIEESDEKKRDARLFLAQLAISERLPIRFVNKNCHGVEISGLDSRPSAPRTNDDFNSAIPEGFILESTGSIVELARVAGVDVRDIGSLCPTDKNELFSNVFQRRATDVCFVSVDWSGDWLKILDDEEMNSYSNTKDSSCDLSEVLRKSNRVRTESEIPTSLEDCLRHFTKEEVLDESNSWYCGSCKVHRQACKTVNLWKLPDVLILGLKRYKQQESETWFGPAQMRRKIDNFVDFPVDGLDLRSSLDPRSPEKDCLFDLFAVCNHYGRMGFGHYTAAARNWEKSGLSQQWYSYDDDRVEKCGTSDVKSSSAYVLFYRKRISSGDKMSGDGIPI